MKADVFSISNIIAFLNFKSLISNVQKLGRSILLYCILIIYVVTKDHSNPHHFVLCQCMV